MWNIFLRFPLKERRRSTIKRFLDPFFIGIAADREPTLVSRANESSGSGCIVQLEPLRATQRNRGSRGLIRETCHITLFEEYTAHVSKCED